MSDQSDSPDLPVVVNVSRMTPEPIRRMWASNRTGQVYVEIGRALYLGPPEFAGAVAILQSTQCSGSMLAVAEIVLEWDFVELCPLDLPRSGRRMDKLTREAGIVDAWDADPENRVQPSQRGRWPRPQTAREPAV